jgi:hypothetical protein
MKKYIQSTINSPFRADRNPSWGVYQNSKGDFRWKDLGTGDGGDEISFLARLLNIDEHENFRHLVATLSVIATELNINIDVEVSGEVQPEVKQPRVLPDRSQFKPGTSDQIQQLASLRGISVNALNWAQQRGVLIFGNWFGQEVCGVTDKAGELVEIRRLDGEDYPAYENLQARKSHAIKHSDKSWPIGIHEAQAYPCIALVEGLPDFLAAHDFILREQAAGGGQSGITCAPVGILSANVKISEDALPLFRGKIVRVFSHGDEAGLKAASRWIGQLEAIGAQHISLFPLGLVGKLTAGEIKDLNDMLRLIDAEPLKNYPSLRAIIPTT